MTKLTRSLAVLVVLASSACRTSSSSGTRIANRVPVIGSISPTSATAGDAAFVLTVHGAEFVNGSTVLWNGGVRVTTFVSATQLTTAIPAADIANVGTVSVTVFNTPPAGGTSNPSVFTTNAPMPMADAISPSAALAGDPAFLLTVTGSRFMKTSVVQWDGVARPTSFVTSSQLTASIAATDIANAGSAVVTVMSPAPGGGTTAAKAFAITNPAPTLSSLTPNAATVGDNGVLVSVNGTGFVQGSVVHWGGAARSTSFVDATKLMATFLATDLLMVGDTNVTVVNATPGGGTSDPKPFTVNYANPSISALVPNAAAAGSGAFTLTINGSNFVPASKVNWGSKAVATNYVNGGQLTAAVPAASVATVGVINVTVVTPSPGGGSSNSLAFSVENPLPIASSLSPASVAVGSGAFTLTVNGSGFVAGSVIQWNGGNRQTNYINAGQLTASIFASDVTAVGTSNVNVANPVPGGGASGLQVFTVTVASNPVPVLTSLSPNTLPAGSAGFTLTVNGSNFISTSAVQWNGNGKSTTYVSGSQLTALIAANDLAAPGAVSVTVANPLPGGGVSSPQVFTVSNTQNPVPSINSLSPGSIAAGSSALTVTVYGTDFVSGSVVQWNGANRSTNYVDSGQLTVSIASNDVTTAGSINVNVFNPTPGGGLSASKNFTVTNSNNPVPTLASLSPGSATVGDGALTLTVNGTNFVGNSVVQWNGSNRSTAYINSAQLTALITTSDLASAGSFNVNVVNSAPGGGMSASRAFVVNAITGGNFNCAILKGSIQCWGHGKNGQLGNNDTFDSNIPVKVVGIPSGAQAVAVASQSACAIVNGGAQCWGVNSKGQLGNNATTESHGPVQVQGLTGGVEALAAGWDHTCALVNGGVQCWGANDYGQLGNGTTNGSSVPVSVQGLGSGVQALSAGASHTCALKNGGVQCWGRGDYGNLGNSATSHSSVPVQVLGLTKVQAIGSGLQHNCAISDGAAQCWGRNNSGQLGDGGTTQSSVPIAVQSLTAGVQAIAGGRDTSCALVNGGLQCWGFGGDGELGNGASSTSATPVAVQGMGSGVQSITLGYLYGCAQVNGALKCWGANNSGQLGNGSITTSNVPTQVQGFNTKVVISVAAGGGASTCFEGGAPEKCTVSCAVVNGGVQCWGGNNNYQLGNNPSFSGTPSAVPVQVFGLTSGAQAIASGWRFACALVDGGGRCWGANDRPAGELAIFDAGQLGNNSSSKSGVPVHVYGLDTGVQSITAGALNACAVVNGGAQCWGYNGSGRLGNNQTINSKVPVPVTGLQSGVQAISSGGAFSCALVKGAVQCWGDNTNGELGDGSTTNSSIPVPVSGLTADVQAVAVGGSHACAILNGGMQCWGSNLNGQLGNNTTVQSAVPVLVNGLSSGVQAIACNNNSTCALVNGSVQCWGANASGQVGNGSTTDSYAPLQVSGLAGGAATISGASSGAHFCSMVGGAALCWGANGAGQLGNGSFTDSSVPVTVSPFL